MTSGSYTSNKHELVVGQKWSGVLGKERVIWTVTWVGKKKARLKAEMGFGWANATVWIDRMLDNPDWERVT